jgi:uracil-DNA glycosylase family 4
MPPGRAPLPPEPRAAALRALAAEIIECRTCPRLVAWREEAAAHPPARFAAWRYWARPLPGFGDPLARVLVVGLAPAAHGGNRTGRIFTGDRSGDFLFASLYRTGFASQPTSVAADDGQCLRGLYIAAVNRCAPPDNRPTPEERDNCLPYLVRELELLADVRAVVALGAYAWDGFLLAAASLGVPVPRPKPRFGHGVEVDVGPWRLIGCFHPSQQNTFTGRLTDSMADAVFLRAREIAGLDIERAEVLQSVPKLP